MYVLKTEGVCWKIAIKKGLCSDEAAGADPYQTVSKGKNVKDLVENTCWDDPEMLKLFDVA